MIATIYHAGGFVNAPPGNGRKEEYDSLNNTLTSWNESGQQVSQRTLTQSEINYVLSTEKVVSASENYSVLVGKAAAALATNVTYLGQPVIPANPTLTQLTAAVRVIRDQTDALTKQTNALIKIALEQLDDVIGT